MKLNYKRLGQYIQPVDIRNTDDKRYNLLGVSVEKRFIESIANTVGTDWRSYKIIKKGQFCYISDTSRRGDKIGIALLSDREVGLVSSAYTVFEIVSDELLPEYLMLWFSRPEFDRYARFHSHGSVREIFDWEEMCNVELPVPPVEEQRAIIQAYKTIERRIELKRKINDNLEAQEQALYKFLVNEREPNSIFSQIATVESGKRPNTTINGCYPLIGAGGIMSFIDEFNYAEKILVTGRVGTHGIIQRISSNCWASDNTLVIKSKFYEYAYQFLKSVDWEILNRGSTQPLVTQTDIKNLPIYIPPIEELRKYEIQSSHLMTYYEDNVLEVARLQELTSSLISSLSKY